MAFKRRNKSSAEFSMASMTDIVFLLLIFFMIISTILSPGNAIKVTLPEGSQKTSEKPIVRIVIDKSLNYYVAKEKEAEHPIAFNDIESFLKGVVAQEPDTYIALYADETIPYGEIVKILNVANDNKFKLVLATRPAIE